MVSKRIRRRDALGTSRHRWHCLPRRSTSIPAQRCDRRADSVADRVGAHESRSMRDRTGSSAPCSKPLLFLFSALLGLAAPAVAQQRTQPDSIRLDSIRRAAGDSLHVVADSVKPPPVLVKHAAGFSVDYGGSAWEWTRDQLLLSHAITLGELMREIPSIAAVRTGLFLQPDLIAPFGETRGSVQVLLDGYELDPLTEASVDFARIELANLNHVRVERRLDVTRIELQSLEPT